MRSAGLELFSSFPTLPLCDSCPPGHHLCCRLLIKPRVPCRDHASSIFLHSVWPIDSHSCITLSFSLCRVSELPVSSSTTPWQGAVSLEAGVDSTETLNGASMQAHDSRRDSWSSCVRYRSSISFSACCSQQIHEVGGGRRLASGSRGA